MEFHPDDIAGRDFLSAVGGFDREEVRRFLEAVAAEVREKNRRIDDLTEKVRMLEARSSEPTAMSVDTTSLDQLQDEASGLVAELRSSVEEASSLVSELRRVEQEETSEPSTPAIDPSPPAASELPHASEVGRPAVEVGPRPIPYRPPTVTTPDEWEALLNDPQ